MAPSDLFRHRRLGFAFVYLILLLASHGWRGSRHAQPVGTSIADRVLRISSLATRDSVDLAFSDDGAPGDPRPVIIALHGSPGSSGDFVEILRSRQPHVRWLTVDLPGFGRSTRKLSDYSFETHAAAVRSLLDARGVDRAHLLAFSMGGGVALELYEGDRARVASLILLSSIGVQELELLGNYELNHALHGLQLAALWWMHEAVPHFGALDDFPMDLSFAQNFFDSDQRPLRGLLAGFNAPVLILHGRSDPLVPFAAAREHHRILPHSELREFDGGHFLPWQRGSQLAQICTEWVEKVEGGLASQRSEARPDRRERAGVAFRELQQPAAEGIAWLLLMALLALGTFVAEDLSCLSAGILIAQGRIGWPDGILACAAGIFFGDLLLYASGRFVGSRLVERRPFRWFVSRRKLAHAEHWFQRRGMAVIFITRFIPGTRLPAYMAAGVLRTPFLKFAGYFLLAVMLWTPTIVGLSAMVGGEALARLREVQYAGVLILMLLALILFAGLHLLLPLSTRKGRRLLWGRWRRLRRWEFWPAWLVYLLLLPHFVRLSLRHGGFHTATAVNPGIETGGLLGESKSQILLALGGDREEIAPFVYLPAGESLAARMRRLEARGLRCPLVVKPDVGERGHGVEICLDDDALQARVGSDPRALVVQDYVDGLEFGVFYARHPQTSAGRIVSIARKILPRLRADGRSTIEELILADDRAVCLASLYLDRFDHRLDEIPADGDTLELAELGTHCRGAVFLDGGDLDTPELLAAIESIVAGWPQFQFGRFDLKAPSEEALMAGRGIRVLELNGLSSEAAHIYDPRYSLGQALQALREQWTLAFEIAAAQRAQGVRPTGAVALLGKAFRHTFRPSN